MTQYRNSVAAIHLNPEMLEDLLVHIDAKAAMLEDENDQLKRFLAHANKKRAETFHVRQEIRKALLSLKEDPNEFPPEDQDAIQPTERVKELLNPMLLPLPNEDETKHKIYAQKPQKVRVINGCWTGGNIDPIERFQGWDSTKDDHSSYLIGVIDAIRLNPDLTVPEILFMLNRLRDSIEGFCPFGLIEDTKTHVKHLRYEVLE